MKKILFGITSLGLGGAERVLVDIVNKLSDEYDITIFTIYGKGELEKQLTKKVKVKSLYAKSYSELSTFQKYFSVPLKILLQKQMIYQKKIKGDYEIEIAFLEGPITRLLSTKNKNTRKFVWVHNDISLVFGKGIKANIKKQIDKKVYQKYEKIVFVSQDNKRKFKQIYPNLKNEQLVIYNYIDKEKVLKKAKQEPIECFDKNCICLVTVARLVQQKAIDRLIRVHKKLLEENLQHKVYVIGDGPLKAKLEQEIQEKGIKSSFELLGKKENPYPYIQNADYFCLLSYFEGYGMVLEEAKILGKSIIITDTAAREAVENYKNSIILANDENAIYEGLKEVIQKKEKNINNEKEETYDNDEIIEKIKDVIEKNKEK
ncbi:MAG: glycosyltransferase [Clostridia bacterium]|nr:glycosyltransferase [Clostridia bacterium]